MRNNKRPNYARAAQVNKWVGITIQRVVSTIVQYGLVKLYSNQFGSSWMASVLQTDITLCCYIVSSCSAFHTVVYIPATEPAYCLLTEQGTVLFVQQVHIKYAAGAQPPSQVNATILVVHNASNLVTAINAQHCRASAQNGHTGAVSGVRFSPQMALIVKPSRMGDRAGQPDEPKIAPMTLRYAEFEVGLSIVLTY